jgi:hypothetical protein
MDLISALSLVTNLVIVVLVGIVVVLLMKRRW